MSNQEQLYNLKQIESIASGNKEFIDKMVSMFLDLTPELVTRIEDGITNQDWDEVKAAAHKMKPSIDLMGIVSLHDVVRELENRGRERRNLDDISSVFTTLKETLEKVFDDLKRR